MTKAHRTGLCGRFAFPCIRGSAFALLASSLLLGSKAWGGVPSPAKMMEFRPRISGVDYTTPATDKVDGCKVDWIKDTPKGGWTLTVKDAEGNLLRRFVDTNGDNRPDIWSYYKDGAEVYAEIDTVYDKAKPYPDQYRWFNAGGSRWGVDENKDGRIDSWKVISPEEVSQEILQALIAKDFERLRPLMLSEAELKALNLPGDQVSRIREQLKAAPDKFQETSGKLTKLSAKATWIHLETVAPQCVAPDGAMGRAAVIKHARGTLLYDNGGSSDWIQTGEMFRIGNVWRLVGAPIPGAAAPESPANGKGGSLDNLDNDPELQKLISQLTELDKQAPTSSSVGANPALARHHMKRADILEAIVAKVKAAQRDPWVRQVADSFSTAAQASEPRETAAMDRLVSLEKQLNSSLPAGHTLTAYVTFREMQADYARKLPGGSGGKDFKKVQEEWLGRLSQFVQSFPKGEDTPDAMLQAGMVSEFLDKEVEAKNWYKQLAERFPEKPQARKAEGSVARLELEGKSLKLSGPMLNDPNIMFDLDRVRGKVIVVYYWASYGNDNNRDFTRLKRILDAHAEKVALVCVNLDSTTEEARKYLSSSPAPGTHLHQDGGLESKLATDYGIQVLPTIFVVGKDGKVVSRNGQIANLEDEVKKLAK